MSQSVISQDLYVNGGFSAKTMTIPASAVNAAAIVASAGVEATKLQHQHTPTYGQNGTSAAATVPLHLAYGDGEVVGFRAGVIGALTGDATTTVDLKKNGTTALSAVITLDNANAARVAEAATVSVTDYVAGDLFEVVVAVNAGTGALGTGLFAQAILREDAQ